MEDAAEQKVDAGAPATSTCLILSGAPVRRFYVPGGNSGRRGP